jgi:transcriptional regulator with XRE-family HTH domain
MTVGILTRPEGGTMTGETFAVKLKRLRETAGLTQPQLAERAGMNQFGVAKLEQGVREPSWATVQALAAALGVSCEAFTDRKPRRKKGGAK